jgi:hypothetical protein
MKITGICFFLLAAIAMIVGLLADISPATEITYGPYSQPVASSVANFRAMHVQGLVFQAGFAALIAGAIFFGLGVAVERLGPGARAQGDAAAAAPGSTEAGAQAAAATSPAQAAPAETDSLFPVWMLILAIAFVVIVAVTVLASTAGNDSAGSGATVSSDTGNAALPMESGIADDPATRDAEAAIRQAESDIASGRLTSDEENAVTQAESDIANASR